MKRTNQVAALRMMGIRPADYLLTPLVWGMILAMPVVTVGGVVAAAGAAAIAAHAVSGTTAANWATAYFMTVDARDALVVLAKSTVSGYLVALACYHLGTAPKRSGADVGESVNDAIVVGMGLVLAVILLYVVLDAPDPRHFGIATYLLYAAFTSVLVAESMRHTVPPTSDSE